MDDKKIIIGLIGEIAAGKTTATDYLQEKYSAVTFRFSDMLRDILTRIHLPINRTNMQTLSTILRQNFSEDIMSKVLTADVKESNAKVIVTEGIRRPSDTIYLKKLDNFNLIYINTDQKTRYERLTTRTENTDDQKKTWEQFQQDCLQESEQKIQEVAGQADFVINNNGSIEEMYLQIDKILVKLMNS